MKPLAVRQVHLDFHTSEWIPDIGEGFQKENFQEALQAGWVDSVTVFAKCHHAWCYYPSRIGTIHPRLRMDLTGAMIDAAHEIGVRAPIYITVGWAANDAETHPEWLARNKDGSLQHINYDVTAAPEDTRPAISWKLLCPSGAYAQHIFDLTGEICERYPVVDGLFYDICFIGDQCYCESCAEGMKKSGLDPMNESDARKYYMLVRRELMMKCTSILRKKHPEATIFFNGGADQYRPQCHDLQSHFELEDLPTTWGGYDKMPPRAKFFARTGKDYLGMTGKFHTSWGEFGGFKNPDALRFECASMLAYGARCSVGDQMHPSGQLDLDTYRTIGQAYSYVGEIQDYCYNAAETTRLGIVLSQNKRWNEAHQSDEGLVKILLEKQMDFDIVLPGDDLSWFETVILPDEIYLEEDFAGELKRFVEKGGSILLTGESGLDMSKSKFLLDVGAEYQGPGRYEIDYVCAGDKLSEGIVKSPFLFYEKAQRVETTDGEVLARIREPYFDRTYECYCSHQNTPCQLDDAPHPAAVKKGSIVYLAHKVCSMYFQKGAQYHRDYLINALKLIYGRPVMKVCMPSAGRARLARQITESRYVLHLLYGSPIQRGVTSVIEDLPPLYDVPVEIRAAERIKKVYLVPGLKEISFRQAEDRVEFKVPRVECHQMVVLEYQ